MSLFEKLNNKYKESNSITSNQFDIEFTELIKNEINILNDTILINVAEDGFYTVFKYTPGVELKYMNMTHSHNCLFYTSIKRHDTFQLDTNVITYNKKTKKINPKYIYDTIKQHIKPIDNVKPEFDDVNMTIIYSWTSLPEKPVDKPVIIFNI
jgi:hypothetical protein